jgi:hypothetical protein
MTTDMPEDVKREWFSLLRRLQSVSKSGGYSIVKICALVDADGTPVAWTEPTQTKIEPKSLASALLSLDIMR